MPSSAHISARRQKFPDGAVLLPLGGEIDVGEDPLRVLKQMQIVGALQAIGDGAEDAQTNALGLGVADEAESFVDEFQIETGISRHFSQIEPHQSASEHSSVAGLVTGQAVAERRSGHGLARSLLLIMQTQASFDRDFLECQRHIDALRAA